VKALQRKKAEPTPRAAPKRRRAVGPNSNAGLLRSLSDEAYEVIKHRIITCELKPGEYVNEASLSAELNLGRTPVHQALGRLRLEGMVEILPRKGVIVKPVSLDEVLQIIEVRLLSEVHCAGLAAERAEGRDIAEMESILKRAEASAKSRDIERMMLLDREFHVVIARAARNAVLADILLKLHERSLRFWMISLTAPGHHRAVQDQHEAILSAIRGGDPAAAQTAMRNHIESFRKNIVQYV
jgi:DNA-binding GntR family transcriptional regulator